MICDRVIGVNAPRETAVCPESSPRNRRVNRVRIPGLNPHHFLAVCAGLLLLLTSCMGDCSPTEQQLFPADQSAVSESPPSASAPSSDVVNTTGVEEPLREPSDVVLDRDPIVSSVFAPYLLTATESAELHFAHEALVDECMSDFGLGYGRATFDTLLQYYRVADFNNADALYGLRDSAVADIYGYQGLTVPQLQSLNSGYSSNYLVLYGDEATPNDSTRAESPGAYMGRPIPPGGCIQEGFRLLGDSGGIGWDSIALGIYSRAANEVEGSKEYRDSVGEWTSCMKDMGHTVTHPVFDQADISEVAKGRAGGPNEEERELALADVQCKDDVKFVFRVDQIRLPIEESVVAQHRAELDADRAEIDAKLERARTHVERLERQQ